MKLTDRAETINVDYHRSQQGVQNELSELRRRRIEWSPFYKVLSFILNLYVSWIPVLNKWRSPFTLRSITIWRLHRRQFLGCFKISWQGSRCAGAWHIDTMGKYVCTTYDRTSIEEERTPGSEERLYRSDQFRAYHRFKAMYHLEKPPSVVIFLLNYFSVQIFVHGKNLSTKKTFLRIYFKLTFFPTFLAKF